MLASSVSILATNEKKAPDALTSACNRIAVAFSPHTSVQAPSSSQSVSRNISHECHFSFTKKPSVRLKASWHLNGNQRSDWLAGGLHFLTASQCGLSKQRHTTHRRTLISGTLLLIQFSCWYRWSVRLLLAASVLQFFHVSTRSWSNRSLNLSLKWKMKEMSNTSIRDQSVSFVTFSFLRLFAERKPSSDSLSSLYTSAGSIHTHTHTLWTGHECKWHRPKARSAGTSL